MLSEEESLNALIANGATQRVTRNRKEEKAMSIFLFRVKITPTSEAELKEVSAPDFVKAVQTLAAWRPGIHILKLEGVFTNLSAHA